MAPTIFSDTRGSPCVEYPSKQWGSNTKGCVFRQGSYSETTGHDDNDTSFVHQTTYTTRRHSSKEQESTSTIHAASNVLKSIKSVQLQRTSNRDRESFDFQTTASMQSVVKSSESNRVLPWGDRKPAYLVAGSTQCRRTTTRLHRRWSAQTLLDNMLSGKGEEAYSTEGMVSVSQQTVPLKSFVGYSFICIFALFVLEVLTVKKLGPYIQALSAPLTDYYQSVLDNEMYEDFSEFLHHAVSSHAWLLLCAIIYWTVDAYEGANLYCLTSLGYYLKSLAKNLIQSPRVFWVSEHIQCFYCGKGYSLPSGHSMISLLVLLFCAYKIREPWIWLFLILFELTTFVNVVYIGTHSFADVLVGWTGAILVFVLYLGVESIYLYNRTVPTLKQQVHFFMACLIIVLMLDMMDSWMIVQEFPASYQINMARACRIAPDRIAESMRLPLNMSNTWGVAGLATGFVLRSEMLNDKYRSNMDKMLWWERLITLVVGTVVFMKSSVYLGRIMRSWKLRGMFYQVYNFVLPILVLVCVPVVVLFVTRHLTPGKYKESRYRQNHKLYESTVCKEDVHMEVKIRSREP
eukprot:CFRG0103T1